MTEDSIQKRPCTNCLKRMAEQDYTPFCSKRCADVDLGRWLKGGYVIAGRDGDAAMEATDMFTPNNYGDDNGNN